MHAFDVVTNFFKQGGFFLYPIALVWIIGLAIAVERFLYLTRIGRGNDRLWGDLQPLFEAGDFKQATATVAASEGVLAQVMRYGMSRIHTARRRDDVEKAMEESLVEVVQIGRAHV